MAHKNKRRNIQSIQHATMCHVYYFGLNPGWEKVWFQLALDNTFWPTHNPSPTYN